MTSTIKKKLRKNYARVNFIIQLLQYYITLCTLKLDIDSTYFFLQEFIFVYRRHLQENSIQHLPENVFSGLGNLWWL